MIGTVVALTGLSIVWALLQTVTVLREIRDELKHHNNENN